jgi:hypothetical protein
MRLFTPKGWPAYARRPFTDHGKPSRLMTPLEAPPGFIPNLFTLGIARARWVAGANQALAQGGAGFWFAWFLLPFANYGLAERLNGALRQAGSSHQVSPVLCFLFTGWPLFGATRRFKRGVAAYNDAIGVGVPAAAVAHAPDATTFAPVATVPVVPETPAASV